MNNKKIIFGIIIIIALAIIFGILGYFSPKKSNPEINNSTSSDLLAPPINVNDTAATFTTKIPENIPTIKPEVATTTKNGELKRFGIKMENEKFSPSQIAIKQNDILNIEFKAIDKDYDVAFNSPSLQASFTIKKGETRAIVFSDLKKGTHTFSCATKCSKEMSGALIVQ